MKIHFRVTLLLILLVALNSCDKKTDKPNTFLGDVETVRLAEQMFKAIGGKEAWCELKSLYIKAEHSEPDMSIPYQSEIWRATDRFELIIEQQNDSFHVKGIVNDKGGTIRYYDKRDTFRILTQQQLKNWEFDHFNNVYVLLHKISCNPREYITKIGSENRLEFYKDSVLTVAFELDEKLRPYKFFRPSLEGELLGSIFTRWETHNGLVHSAGGHPLDSNFVYKTKVWKPSNKPLKETFDESVFNFE